MHTLLQLVLPVLSAATELAVMDRWITMKELLPQSIHVLKHTSVSHGRACVSSVDITSAEA
jgi:hypothetical protein